jgi:hypothetical protein
VKTGWLCIQVIPTFKAGDQPPKGYLAWHEWARVQLKAGLRQKRCIVCGLLRFPQEKCCSPEAVGMAVEAHRNAVTLPTKKRATR